MGRSQYDDIHDRIDPIATTKAGTRYERLAAIVQKALDDTVDVTHDIKLVGVDTEVKHQIDVTIRRSEQSKRLLIECKDYDVSGDPVGLSIIRDFYGVVDDVKPDEALVITCNRFTEEAMKFAKGKNIKLAILRKHTDDDDEGLITSVNISAEVKVPIYESAGICYADEAGQAEIASGENASPRSGADLYFHMPGSLPVRLIEALNRMKDDAAFGSDVLQEDGSYKRKIRLSGASISRGEGPLVSVHGFDVIHRLHTHHMSWEIHRTAVSLILQRLDIDADSSTDLFIYEDRLKQYCIDSEGKVLHKQSD